MTNSLTKYPHIQFKRNEVSKRIKETKNLLKSFKLIAEHPDQEHKLFLDESTNEYWQLAYAWNWGAKPYGFIVPLIRVEEWQKERYVDPDELLIYVASMQNYLAIPTNRQIKNLPDHVKQLQKMGNLPKDPEGRWFGPYKATCIEIQFVWIE